MEYLATLADSSRCDGMGCRISVVSSGMCHPKKPSGFVCTTGRG